MTNHDTALVLALWAIAAITYGLVLLHDRSRNTADLFEPELTDAELSDAEIDTEFAALTTGLERPYDHETDGL